MTAPWTLAETSALHPPGALRTHAGAPDRPGIAGRANGRGRAHVADCLIPVIAAKTAQVYREAANRCE